MSPRFTVEPVEDFIEPEEYGEELRSETCWFNVVEKLNDDGDEITISSHIDEHVAIAKAEKLNAAYERDNSAA